MIRHAVSIDERRAKFRADLISEEGRRKTETDAARAKHMSEKHAGHHHHQWAHVTQRFKPKKRASIRVERSRARPREPRKSARYRSHSRSHALSVAERSVSPEGDGSLNLVATDDGDESSDNDEDEKNQVIDEVWFSGGHADIGGGWGLAEGEYVDFSSFTSYPSALVIPTDETNAN